MKKKFIITIFSATVLTTLVPLTGCVSNNSLLATPESIVAHRAQERWNHLVADDYVRAYSYLVPAYRAVVSVENYRDRFGSGAAWKDPMVKSVNCETEDRCTVDIRLGVTVVARGFGGKPLESNLIETWLKEDGQWWFYQK